MLHPALVHLPIALLLLWPALDALGWALRRPDLGATALGLLGLGAASSLAAVVSGQAALDAALDAGHAGALLATHGQPAGMVPWMALGLFALRVYGARRWPRVGRALALALGLALAIWVVMVAASGGALVYEHGVGVQTHPG